MTPDNLEILARLVQARSGLVIDPSKTYVIDSVLGPVARRENFASIDEMMSAIRVRRDDRLMWAVAEAMSPSETLFFRDRTPFAAFRDEMLPALASLRAGESIKVWSCACGPGQEIYSLAMVVDEDRPKLGAAKVELFASDLSEAALAKAQAGLYTQFEVQRGLPIKLLLRYFEKEGELWRVSPGLRQLVRWRRINLLADLSPLGKFDVIFCRNVTGDFDGATRDKVLSGLAGALREGGYLVLGRDEAADGQAAITPLPGYAGIYTRGEGRRAAAA